jgi:N-acyl-D-amino-acid deacylase
VTDLLIRGGLVIDGTGAPPLRGDVAVTDGRITDVGDIAGRHATRMIDARDRIVAPGFIDIHSHSDNTVFVNDAFESALHMGVTLVVCGNCGSSSAPVSGLAAEELDRALDVLEARRTWSSFAEYAQACDDARPAINLCSYVGHGTLRKCVMGGAAHAPSHHELDAMKTLLSRAMDEGAIGLASGLIYPPSA